MLFRSMLWITALLFSLNSLAQGSLVILQYHNVSDKTPRSTSVSLEELQAHMQWLKANNFTIKALDEAVNAVREGKLAADAYTAAITFDDSHKSVCDTAWPYLQQEKIPFTVFINSDPIARNFKSQCTTAQLKAMTESGLVIIGNHGKDHAHMTDKAPFADDDAWLAAMEEEILSAENFILKHFGKQPKLFAYPYGEYNKAIEGLLVKHSYIAFGQQSGAIGPYADFLGLPRFPLSGTYASLKTIPDKLKSLAFPATVTASSDNPVAAKNNPPTLTLNLAKTLPRNVQCFLSSGTAISVKKDNNTLYVQAEQPLKQGRERYNCTSLSDNNGRYYWLSHQWLME